MGVDLTAYVDVVVVRISKYRFYNCHDRYRDGNRESGDLMGGKRGNSAASHDVAPCVCSSYSGSLEETNFMARERRRP